MSTFLATDFRDRRSFQSSPPQSAQPYRSVFNEASSQDGDEVQPPTGQNWGYYEAEHYNGLKMEVDDSQFADAEDELGHYNAAGFPMQMSDGDHDYKHVYEDNDDDYGDPPYEQGAEDADADDDDDDGADEGEYKAAAQVKNESFVLELGKQVTDAGSGSTQRNQLPPATTPSSMRSGSASPPLYRPHRFKGPDSTWRKLTREERDNAEALEAMRAKDLAAHLFNAFALRKRARDRTHGRIGQHGVQGDEMHDFFTPPPRWGAWPMLASEVPRANGSSRVAEGKTYGDADDGAWTLRMPCDLRPSAELEECLIAFFQKVAKERFNARGWRRVRVADRRRRPASASSQPEDDDSNSNNNNINNNNTDEYETELNSEPDPADAGPLRPVVQADDDKARWQLRPLARRILAEVDKLLTGLHHAQKATVGYENGFAGEWLSDSGSQTTTSVSPGRQTSTRRGLSRSQSRGRRRSRKDSSGSKSASCRRLLSDKATAHVKQDLSAARRSQSRGRTSNEPRRQSSSRARQGLRDWSDVLGIAALTGWPAEVVMRASERCAHLFGEDMMFRTFKEGKVRVQQKGESAWAWEYVESHDDNDDEDDEDDEDEDENDQASPVHTAKRTTPLSASEQLSRAASAPEARQNGPHDHLVCPITTCPRHCAGFSRLWNLRQHMKRMHGATALSKSLSRSPLPASRSGSGSGSGGRRHGAASAADDTQDSRPSIIVCPVETCARHIDGFSRPWNLNRHLKIVHQSRPARGWESEMQLEDG